MSSLNAILFIVVSILSVLIIYVTLQLVEQKRQESQHQPSISQKPQSDKKLLESPPNVPTLCSNNLPKLSFSNSCSIFTEKKMRKIMSDPDGVCMFDLDGTLLVKPAFTRNEAVKMCLRNNFAVGVITAGGYKNAHYFCEELHLKDAFPCLCDFFSVNKGVTFFQNQPLVNDKYCYAPCQGNCGDECFQVQDDIPYRVSRHTLAKTCALNQVHQMYPDLDKKCISLIDNEHSWTCDSEDGEGCAGFGGQWSPQGVTEVDIQNLISHCKNH